MTVILEFVGYQPVWALRGAREIARVRRALGEGCTAAHHVGATSVPGMAATPIIDLAVAIETFAVLQAARLRMMTHGFRATAPVDRRPVFQALCPMSRQVAVEVVCYLPADPFLLQAVALAAHLRARAAAAQEYEAFKRRARTQHTDPAAYRLAKQDWISRQLATQGTGA